MAGAGYKLFNTGDVLTAAQVNTYLQEQTVMVFASSAARTSALSGVLAEGMVSYLQDTNAVEVYNGSAWVGVSGAGDVTEVQAGTGISVASGTGPIPVVTNTMATAVDAKGDLIVGTGADTFARLAVGTNGHTLVADSSVSPTGLKWAAPAGGGGLVYITKSTFSGSSAVNFDNCFSATYDNYLVVGQITASSTQMTSLRYRASGSNDTNDAYITRGVTNLGSGLTAEQDTLTSMELGNNADYTLAFALQIISPNLSKRTVALWQNSTSGAAYPQIYRGWNNVFENTTVFDGLGFFPASGTFSGTITIYGYALS